MKVIKSAKHWKRIALETSGTIRRSLQRVGNKKIVWSLWIMFGSSVQLRVIAHLAVDPETL